MVFIRRPSTRLAFQFASLCVISFAPSSCAFQPRPAFRMTTRPRPAAGGEGSRGDCDGAGARIYFDVAIVTQFGEEVPLGRLTFLLTPPTHPRYLPLHISNLVSLASGQRKSIDPKATYEGCEFQYSPATIDDGSFRYRWGHAGDGYGKNGIQATLTSGMQTSWDEPFSDPERLMGVAQKCFGGVYYGQRYSDIANALANDGLNVAVLLTVPIHGPGAGTSKFSIVRVSESSKEWGERLLLNSAVVGYLDCGADGRPGREAEDVRDHGGEGYPTSLDVLRAMARQRLGAPTIISCGATSP